MDEKAAGFEQRIKQIEEKLDILIENHKLSFDSTDSEIDEIFTIGVETLSRLNIQKLEEYAFIIARYSVYLTKELNKSKGLLNWARRGLDAIVLPKMTEYRSGYMSSEEVKMKAIKGNDVAIKFYQYMVEQEHSVNILDSLSIDVRKMSDTLGNLAKSKRYSNV